jgi:hypothetical protein
MRRSRLIPVVAALLLPLTAAAQTSDPQQSSTPPPQRAQSPDFLFGQPHGLAAVRGGWLIANTGSDLYDFITDQLTIDQAGFDTWSMSGDFGFSLNSRLDIIATLEQAETTTGSEYREFTDTAGVPITQTTRREQWIVSGSVRMALLPRGRRISRFAWLPRTVTPYVGAGAGAVKYDISQIGAFVDFRTLQVFNDSFSSKGWAPTVHALGGTDIRVYQRLYLTTEARYTWSSAELGADFIDFEPVSLGGLRLSAGLQIVF